MTDEFRIYPMQIEQHGAQGCNSCSLTDSKQGSIDPVGAGGECGQRIAYGMAEVIVEMHFNIRLEATAEILDYTVNFPIHAVSERIRHADSVYAGSNGQFIDFAALGKWLVN